jgi:hypothetical protein
MGDIIKLISLTNVESVFIKPARVIFLPEFLNYDDFDLKDPVDLYQGVISGSIRPYLITYKESVRYPVLAEPRNIELTLEDIQSLVRNNYNCKVRVMFWTDREFDHNGECLECDAFPDACECSSPELEDGNYVKLIFQ